MGNIIKIESREIAKAMEGVTRQYLVGNLKLPQKLQHIKSEELEIGISSYPKYTEEPPHKHSKATEYQYVLSGCLLSSFVFISPNEYLRCHEGK